MLGSYGDRSFGLLSRSDRIPEEPVPPLGQDEDHGQGVPERPRF